MAQLLVTTPTHGLAPRPQGPCDHLWKFRTLVYGMRQTSRQLPLRWERQLRRQYVCSLCGGETLVWDGADAVAFERTVRMALGGKATAAQVTLHASHPTVLIHALFSMGRRPAFRAGLSFADLTKALAYYIGACEADEWGADEHDPRFAIVKECLPYAYWRMETDTAETPARFVPERIETADGRMIRPAKIPKGYLL